MKGTTMTTKHPAKQAKPIRKPDPARDGFNQRADGGAQDTWVSKNGATSPSWARLISAHKKGDKQGLTACRLLNRSRKTGRE